MTPAPADDRLERDLLQTQALLARIVAQADRCLADLHARARLTRRVRTAARRRALSHARLAPA